MERGDLSWMKGFRTLPLDVESLVTQVEFSTGVWETPQSYQCAGSVQCRHMLASSLSE